MDMRVAGVNSAYGVYNTTNAVGGKKADGTGKAPTKDDIFLSERAEDYQAVRNALANLPETGEENVKRIKALIDSGEYSVSASEVADKILQGFIG